MARQDELAAVQNELSRRHIEQKDVQNRLDGILIETQATRNDVSRSKDLCQQVADSNRKKEAEVTLLVAEVDKVKAEKANMEATLR